MSKRVYDNQNNQSKTTTGLQSIKLTDPSKELATAQVPLTVEWKDHSDLNNPEKSILNAYNASVDPSQKYNRMRQIPQIQSTGCRIEFGFILLEFETAEKAEDARKIIRNTINNDKNVAGIAATTYNGKHYVAIPQTCYVDFFNNLGCKSKSITDPHKFVQVLRDIYTLQREECVHGTDLSNQIKIAEKPSGLRSLLSNQKVAYGEYSASTAGYVLGTTAPCTRISKTNIPASTLKAAVVLNGFQSTVSETITEYVPAMLVDLEEGKTNIAPIDKTAKKIIVPKGAFNPAKSWFSEETAAVVLTKSGLSVDQVNQTVHLAKIAPPSLLEGFDKAAQEIKVAQEKTPEKVGDVALKAYQTHIHKDLKAFITKHPKEAEAVLNGIATNMDSSNALSNVKTVIEALGTGIRNAPKTEKRLPYSIQKVSDFVKYTLEDEDLSPLHRLLEDVVEPSSQTKATAWIDSDDLDEEQEGKYAQLLDSFANKFPLTLALLNPSSPDKEAAHGAFWLTKLSTLAKSEHYSGCCQAFSEQEAALNELRSKLPGILASYDTENKGKVAAKNAKILFAAESDFTTAFKECEEKLEKSLVHEVEVYQKGVLTGNTTAENNAKQKLSHFNTWMEERTKHGAEKSTQYAETFARAATAVQITRNSPQRDNSASTLVNSSQESEKKEPNTPRLTQKKSFRTTTEPFKLGSWREKEEKKNQNQNLPNSTPTDSPPNKQEEQKDPKQTQWTRVNPRNQNKDFSNIK